MTNDSNGRSNPYDEWFSRNGGRRVGTRLPPDHAQYLFACYDSQIRALPSGGGIAVNHERCPAGVDRKQRLWIHRMNNGTTLVFSCRRCNEKVSLDVRRWLFDDWRGKSTADAVEEAAGDAASGKPVPVLDTPMPHWSSEAIAFVQRSAVPFPVMQKYGPGYFYGFGYGPPGLMLPLYARLGDGENAHPYGYQIRTDSGKPKYRMYVPDDWADRVPEVQLSVYAETEDYTTIVIVEDILSAMHCASVPGTVGVAALGCGERINTQTLLSAVPYMLRETRPGEFEVPTVVVWLDGDNPEVKRHERKLLSRLAQHSTYRVAVPSREWRSACGHKDPKNYQMHELQSALTKYLDYFEGSGNPQ